MTRLLLSILWFVLAAALTAQEPISEADLDRDRQRAYGVVEGPRTGLVTVLARYQDGTPVDGWVSCAGFWFKYQDGEDLEAWDWLPFRTDARGAVVFNPFITDHTSLDDPMQCQAADRNGRRASLSWVMPRPVVTITIHR